MFICLNYLGNLFKLVRHFGILKDEKNDILICFVAENFAYISSFINAIMQLALHVGCLVNVYNVYFFFAMYTFFFAFVSGLIELISSFFAHG